MFVTLFSLLQNVSLRARLPMYSMESVPEGQTCSVPFWEILAYWVFSLLREGNKKERVSLKLCRSSSYNAVAQQLFEMGKSVLVLRIMPFYSLWNLGLLFWMGFL